MRLLVHIVWDCRLKKNTTPSLFLYPFYIRFNVFHTNKFTLYRLYAYTMLKIMIKQNIFIFCLIDSPTSNELQDYAKHLC